MSTDRPFAAAGELEGAYGDVDWSSTSVGPPEGWSATLRSTFEIMARTAFPCTLLWGDDHTLLYNAAYLPVLAEKHPSALGRDAAEVFPEVWDELLPVAAAVRTTGQAVYLRDAPVPLTRGGNLRDAYFTYCYSAVLGPTGAVEGILDIVSETTSTVLATRRLALIDDLRESLADASSPDQVQAATLAVLNHRSVDIATAVIGPPTSTSAPEAGAVSTADPLGRAGRVRVDLRTIAAHARGRELVLTIDDAVDVDEALLAVIRTIGDLVAHALDRSALLSSERRTALAERSFSEALQLSLLGEPDQIDGVEIAVCYVAAADDTRVGGDWYDSFPLPDGTLQIAVGDIAGHDAQAAVTMAQARSILRGIAFCSEGTPAQMLQALDRAFTGLRIAQCSSAIVGRLARVEHGVPGARTTTFQWSNAGHPPPVVIAPDGSVTLLEFTPEPLLGLDPQSPRMHHSIDLAPQMTVVLYTDGLVERRGEHLDTSLARLRDVLRGAHELTLTAVVDRLRDMAGPAPEDDVAMVVLRTRQTTG